MEVSRRMYGKKGTVIVSCVRNLYINRRALPALFVYSSSCSRVRWRNWQNITTLRIRTVDIRSFIYLLSYLSLHAIVLQIYGAGSSPHGLHPCPCTTRFRRRENSRNARISCEQCHLQGEIFRKTKMDFHL